MPNLKLGRKTLAEFLPNHEAIIAFENILEFVGTVGPDALAELLLIVSSLKRVNVAEINDRLADIESASIRGRAQSPAGLEPRIADLEARSPRAPNLSSITDRLDALEKMAARRENLTAILARIENLENITGV
ncbi:MAG: hypothetical protein V4857_14275 [Pseudomonadota bacterium]